MLARRLPGLLPPPSFDEALSVTTIYSVAGLLPTGSGLIRRRPFRAPHHTSSEIALVGGGAQPRPGELTLAHTGVLFLDEVPEFGRRVLETLRQPLESGIIHIARAARSATFPARVLLVGAMNPCPCGYAGQAFPQCRCTPRVVDQYRQRLSGPLRDRFDLSVEVAPVPWQELSGSAGPENSAAVRARVILARSLQMQRQGCLNGTMEGAELRRHAALSPDTAALLGRRAEALGLSARGVHRVLRVARTIADLAGQEGLAAAHLAEALQFRLPGSADRHHVPDAV
jgi:magnesium chelatase family protein